MVRSIRRVHGMVGDPEPNFGFIYILSNASMPGLYKVGLTTSRVGQRINELNTTGVPTSFVAEKVFRISARHLATVEKNAHKRLRARGLHHGKEFFRTSLDTCVKVVEDTILEFTGEQSEDVVGLAKERAAIAERVLQQKQEESARIRAAQARLDAHNNDIRARRNRYVENQLRIRVAIKSFGDLLTLFGAVVGIPMLAVVLYGMFMLGGPLLLICAIGLGWWVHAHDRSQQRRYLVTEAERLFPLASSPAQYSVAPSPTAANPPTYSAPSDSVTYGFGGGAPMYSVGQQE